ncbi:9e3661a3-1fb0-4e36-bec9-b20df0514ef4 [Sclerotinia trifoliorum]|uniref:9e3661a3-1fb0-4e36-bec9-b20df0514ef4 n=1 Tax=Sclerotinia trifoliorum TaxID=28548 RepID=A0A8H2ZMI0_9HELO|nr:9e3661a3-1fb0-4e36-bec9-b20df0514ef4 [Sclerotinia trifoliorum]
MRLDTLAIPLILLLTTVTSVDQLFDVISQLREAAINLNNLLNNATDDSRFLNKDLIEFFKNTTLQNTIFINGINVGVTQREALTDLVSNNGHDIFPLQASLAVIQQLTEIVNKTLFSINDISNDDSNLQDDILENRIATVNLIRCNQLIPAIWEFWNQTANVLGEDQILDLPGPIVCENFDAVQVVILLGIRLLSRVGV